MSVPETANARTERIIGVVLLAIGLVCAYFFVLVPYQAMLSGAESVEFGFKSAAIGPAAILVGLVQLLFAERAPALLGREGGLTARVTDRLKGATEDRRNGATLGWLKRDSNGVSGCGVFGVFCNC